MGLAFSLNIIYVHVDLFGRQTARLTSPLGHARPQRTQGHSLVWVVGLHRLRAGSPAGPQGAQQGQWTRTELQVHGEGMQASLPGSQLPRSGQSVTLCLLTRLLWRLTVVPECLPACALLPIWFCFFPDHNSFMIPSYLLCCLNSLSLCI